MSKLRLAVLIAILGSVSGWILAARPAAAHWSISLGLPLPVPVVPVPVVPAPPCGYGPQYPAYYPYPYYPDPYAAYPSPYVGFSFGPHRFGQPRYFADDWRDGGYRPKARGYTFR